jgi:hypothetical protein
MSPYTIDRREMRRILDFVRIVRGRCRVS